ncbi:MAG: glycosyltransferase family 2 protein [Pseudomonadota bacterium]
MSQIKNITSYARMAIVIPAHNEEKILFNTLESCKQLDYPRDRFEIVVVADNCADNTAMIANDNGVKCLERFDDNNKGKGYALTYAFEHLLKKDFDVFVVLDADCTISRNSLKVINESLSTDVKIFQINYKTANPDVNAVSYACAVGNYIENNFFYKPKANLNISVLLRGTGMAFKREILLKYPWDSFGIVEDVEYSLKLIEQNEKIKFIDKAEVLSEFPTQMNQLSTQRKRWAGGNLNFGKKQALKFLFKGIKQKNLDIFDIGVTFIVLSKPLIISLSIMSLICSAFSYMIYNNSFSVLVFLVAGLNFMLTFSYFIFGVFAFGISLRRFGLLIASPMVILNLVYIGVKGLLEKTSQDWEKTPRND